MASLACRRRWRQGGCFRVMLGVTFASVLVRTIIHIWPLASTVHQQVRGLQPGDIKIFLRRNFKTNDDIIKYYRRLVREKIGKRTVTYEEEDESIYEQRKERRRKFCKTHPDMKLMNIVDLKLHVKKAGLIYCFVMKTGSAFWFRALEVLRLNDSSITSPYQLEGHFTNVSSIKTKSSDKVKQEQINRILNSSLKFVFARNPYQRIFSTFIDKMLAPNPGYGTYIRHEINRMTKTEANIYCGYGTSFTEYVKYITSKKPADLEQHVRPITSLCNLCELDYDVVGKAETFQKDARYIFKKSGVYGKNIIFNDMKLEHDLDYIVSNVLRTFSLKRQWGQCISVQAGMVRLWRQLQINGLIDMTDTYPFSPEQSHNLTVVEYVNVALEAFRRSSPAAKRTKREAYLQAYSMVEPEDLEQLGKGFLTDFEMFDYEQRPEELFDMDRKRRFEYDYFDVMQLK